MRQAADTDALFSAANGKIILPYLKIGNEFYYVELELVDPVNLCQKPLARQQRTTLSSN